MTNASITTGIVFEERADRVAEDHYLVANEAVDLGIDACSCGRTGGCWHLTAATVHQARHPEVAVGDPFISADKNRSCACTGGWVHVGYMDEYGEEREVSYACRRCAEEARE